MIERLAGVCVHKQLNAIVADVNGVGYGVEVTPRTLATVEIGQAVTLWTHTHVTEDALRLFGFASQRERQMFGLLLSVSGLGPKIGMALLAHFEPDRLAEIVEREEAEALEDVPGIGARQSKKFLLELKPKVTKLVAAGALARGEAPKGARVEGGQAKVGLDAALLRDLRSALENFGYKEKELALLLRKYERNAPTQELAGLVRAALAELTGAGRGDDVKDAKIEELF